MHVYFLSLSNREPKVLIVLSLLYLFVLTTTVDSGQEKKKKVASEE